MSIKLAHELTQPNDQQQSQNDSDKPWKAAQQRSTNNETIDTQCTAALRIVPMRMRMHKNSLSKL